MESLIYFGVGVTIGAAIVFFILRHAIIIAEITTLKDDFALVKAELSKITGAVSNVVHTIIPKKGPGRPKSPTPGTNSIPK